MRRLTALAKAGADRSFRLDPFALPARSAGNGGVAFVIDRERVVLKRPSAIGVDMTLAVPVRAYAGIAARVETTEGFAPQVIVELRHPDPALTVPLVVGEATGDVAADWQAWARTLNLPLLVVGQDGRAVEALERLGALTIAGVKPRRRISFLTGRRSRFLRRRKVGHAGPTETLTGREIIARN